MWYVFVVLRGTKGKYGEQNIEMWSPSEMKAHDIVYTHWYDVFSSTVCWIKYEKMEVKRYFWERQFEVLKVF